jgi:hypothetical protein
MRDAYQNLKGSAARRGIYFDLTFEEFSDLCHETEYLKLKGRSRLSYSVDREIEGPLPGYTKTNIRVVPVWYNSAKENYRRVKKVLLYDWQSGTAKVLTTTPETIEFLF